MIKGAIRKSVIQIIPGDSSNKVLVLAVLFKFFPIIILSVNSFHHIKEGVVRQNLSNILYLGSDFSAGLNSCALQPHKYDRN